jgi:hypothetical protein
MIKVINLKIKSKFYTALFFLLMLFAFSNVMAKKDKDDVKIKTDSAELARTETSARNARSSNDDIEIIPLGTAEFPGLCKYRGHIGKYQCKKVSAIKHDRYSCKGKGVYYSKVDGVKGCYTCPDGYKRTSPTRKMNHAKACVNRTGKNSYAAAASRVDNVDSCGNGQFRHKGFCKSCPAKTDRKHFAGIDIGKCKVEKEYRCNAGLSLHKSAPKNIWDRAGNWAGLKHKKYCGLPFNFLDYTNEILNSEANKEIAKGIYELGKVLQKDGNKAKVEKIKQAIKDKKLNEANAELLTFQEFVNLKALARAGEHFTEAQNEARKFALTIGFATDGSIIYGGNYELGIAIDLGDGKLKEYDSYGLTKGVSVAVDGAITVGAWAGNFETSYSQGYTVGVPVARLGYAAGADIGFGIWSDYYTPKRADGLNQPHFVGLSASFGIGSGFEVGEYSEVWTKVKDWDGIGN